MKILMPVDYEQMNKMVDCEMILSPFMYMNYNDAIMKLIEIYEDKRNLNRCLVDFTGLAIETLDSLKHVLNKGNIAYETAGGNISFVLIEEHLKNKINRTLLCDFKNKVLTEMNFFVNSKQWINGFDKQEKFEILEELSTGFYVTYPKLKYFYFII